VKLLNFGLAGLELHSGSAEARELAPTISPQFASPEQLLNREIDFRSEMYSLGATLCFLLTGAAPLAVSGMKARLRIRRLPELRRAPKALHNLLVHLLREDPENRPQDPVALEQEMRECLTKIERRQAIGRKLGIPLAAVIPRKPKEQKEPRSPVAQVLYGIVAFAILLVAGAAAAEFFFPDKIPFLHRSGKIGVPVGVPDTSSIASPPAQSPVAGKVATNQPAPTASPAVASESQNVPNPTPVLTPAGTTTSSQPAAVAQASEPPSPAAALSEESAKTDNSDESLSTESGETNVGNKRKTIASNRTSTSRSERTGRASPYQDEYGRGRTYHGRQHAQVIGRTLDGRPIMRLPSGRVVILRSRYDAQDVYAPRPRSFTQPPNDFVPPRQPFYPPDYPSND
jgi:serine/threonine protein kinase